MRRWLEVLDPRTRIATEVQALAALRLGDVALLASAPLGVLSAAFTKLPQDVIADVAMARGAGQDQRQVVETLSAVMPQFLLGAAIVSALVTLVLAGLQWRYRTWLIPALGLALAGYSAVMLPLDWSDPMVEAVRQQRPVWLVGLEIAVLPPGIAMFWAAFRGGRWLDRARCDGAVTAAG